MGSKRWVCVGRCLAHAADVIFCREWRACCPLSRQLWADEISDAALQERIVKLRVQSGMDKDDLKFIALLLWLGILWQKAMRGRMPSEQWSEDMIPRTIPAVTKWLTRLSTKREPHTA